MTPKDVPFYGNLSDDTHCMQAAFKMILKYYLPNRDFSWEKLEKMSAKVKGMATWPAKMLISLDDIGFDVTLIEGFDAKAFVSEGETYLQREFGKETADWQIKHSDIAQERELYKQLLESNVRYEHRIPTVEDIRHYLGKGYLIKCTINAKKLNHQPGYTGHSVVIFGITDDQVVLHDPGLPAKENRTELIADFEAAWAYPNDKAKELIAVKYKESTNVG